MSRNKLVMVIAFMAVAIFLISGCAQNEPQDLTTPEVTEPSEQDESTASDEKIFTLDELKQYTEKMVNLYMLLLMELCMMFLLLINGKMVIIMDLKQGMI